MNLRETAQRLDELRCLEEETVRALDAGVPMLTDCCLAERLRESRCQHARHAEHLELLANALGEPPAEPAPDFKAYAEMHRSLVEQAHDQDEAVEAMLVTERANAAEYASLDSAQLPMEVAETIHQHLEHERRHVAELEERATAIGPLAMATSAKPARGGAATTGLTDDRSPDDFDDEMFGTDISGRE